MTARLALVAGEASGDLIAARALQGLLAHRPLALMGIGGPELSALGMDCWAEAQQLAVRGYLEALAQIRSILAIRRALIRRLQSEPPHLFLGVDAPDFNLTVERQMRAIGVTTAHLVCPSIWAWRPERLQGITESVDHMFCLFPFEPKLFAGTRTVAHFVGHPLADQIPLTQNRAQARQHLGLSDPRPILAVLPGSRGSEVRLNAPAFLGAAIAMSRSHQVLIPMASPELRRVLQALPLWPAAAAAGVQILSEAPLAQVGSVIHDPTTLSLKPIGQGTPQPRQPLSHRLMAAADLALVASGTATLEAALFRLPMVIGYRVPAITAWLTRRKALVPYVGLPNLLLNRPLVEECLQDQCSAERLTQALRQLADHPSRSEALQAAYAEIHEQLRQGAAQRVAGVLEELL